MLEKVGLFPMYERHVTCYLDGDHDIDLNMDSNSKARIDAAEEFHRNKLK